MEFQKFILYYQKNFLKNCKGNGIMILQVFFSILYNLTKECLLPLLYNNASNNGEDNLNLNIENEQYLINTRVYSNMFALHQPNDFAKRDYILKRVNHSVWFWYGQFHTNTIEGLWSHVKRLTKNFSGLTKTKIDNILDNDNEKKILGQLAMLQFIIKII